MIEQIKQAIFSAEEVLNWLPSQSGHFFFSASELMRHYNEAVEVYRRSRPSDTRPITVDWITGRSAAEAAILWLQEMSLAVSSLQDYRRENASLSEPGAHQILRDSLREWYDYNPTRMQVVAMRMRLCAELSNEEAIESQPIPPEFRSKSISKKLAAKLLGRPNEDSGVKWLNECIEMGLIGCEAMSRQSFVFDIRDFPESVHSQLLPPKSR